VLALATLLAKATASSGAGCWAKAAVPATKVAAAIASILMGKPYGLMSFD
jgi:hypothetical protein